jgi:hypothetical protein
MYQKTIKETIKVATDTLDSGELCVYLVIDHENRTYRILNDMVNKDFVFFGDERLNSNQIAIADLIQQAVKIAHEELNNE